MIRSAIAETLKRRSQDDFKGTVHIWRMSAKTAEDNLLTESSTVRILKQEDGHKMGR
jgi:hypothetical protein